MCDKWHIWDIYQNLASFYRSVACLSIDTHTRIQADQNKKPFFHRKICENCLENSLKQHTHIELTLVRFECGKRDANILWARSCKYRLLIQIKHFSLLDFGCYFVCVFRYSALYFILTLYLVWFNKTYKINWIKF